MLPCGVGYFPDLGTKLHSGSSLSAAAAFNPLRRPSQPTAREGTSVPKQPDKADDLSRAGTIQRLVKETGITETEASDLLTLLGSDWSSLVREAKLLKPKH
jgi:hypothetical protein